MNRQFPAIAGLVDLASGRAQAGNRPWWVVFAGVMMALASQAPMAATTDAAQLVAQLDGVASYCGQHFPGEKAQVQSFMDGLLSQATDAELKQVRASAEYRQLIAFDLKKIGAGANGSSARMCAELAGLASRKSEPARPDSSKRE